MLAGEEEDGRWGALLAIFRESAAPVRAAVQWVESQGYGGALGTSATQGNARGILQSLPLFVSELLARTVVVIEEDYEQSDAGSTVCNCMWIQTLPSAMQADIVTFLSAECQHFHSRDLLALSSTLLATPDTDFWVILAASNMLKVLQRCNSDQNISHVEQNGLLKDNPAFQDYNALPGWLEEYRGTQSLLCSGFPLPQDHVVTEDAKDQVQTCVTSQEVASARNELKASEEEQVVVMTSEITSQVILGKRKRDSESPANVQQNELITEGLETKLSSPDTTKTSGAPDDKEFDFAREALGNDLFARATVLGAALHTNLYHAGLPPDIDIILTASNLSMILKVIKPWLADDETTGLLVERLLGEQSGYARSTQILMNILLPKLMGLREPPSRVLGSAVIQAGKAHPRATVDALLLPLLLQREGPSAVQCDVVNRVVKDCLNPEVVSSLFSKLFQSHTQDPTAVSLVWTEATVGVLHTLIGQKAMLEGNTLRGLVSSLEQVSNQFSASLKFGNLLLNLVTKHRSQLGAHKALLQQVAENTKTFLTKSIMGKISGL